ncbi:MAG TPA: hypothetical protein VMZ06_11595 [Candidatus Bathyarchaeia archaeon]|nr:hypothetical protein [Candidatus Bathyarchaeia archaeon]
MQHNTGEQYLVEATSSAQALRHVTTGMFTVAVASTKDVAGMMANGVKVETAKVAE